MFQRTILVGNINEDKRNCKCDGSKIKIASNKRQCFFVFHEMRYSAPNHYYLRHVFE